MKRKHHNMQHQKQRLRQSAGEAEMLDSILRGVNAFQRESGSELSSQANVDKVMGMLRIDPGTPMAMRQKKSRQRWTPAERKLLNFLRIVVRAAQKDRGATTFTSRAEIEDVMLMMRDDPGTPLMADTPLAQVVQSLLSLGECEVAEDGTITYEGIVMRERANLHDAYEFLLACFTKYNGFGEPPA